MRSGEGEKMVRHRCSRCKEDVGEDGIRHKYGGGLFCEPCLRSLVYTPGRHVAARGFFWSIWDKIARAARSVFKPTAVAENRAVKVAYSIIENKARIIPRNAQALSPQKR